MGTFAVKHTPYLVIIVILSGVFAAWLPAGLAKLIEYGADIVLAVCSVVYFIRNKNILLDKYRTIACLYIFLLIYVVAALIKIQFVQSGMFPFYIMRMLTNFCCFGLIFIFMNEKVVRKTMKLWWKYVPILFIISFWKLAPSMYIGVLSFVLVFIIIINCLSKKQKLFTILAFIFIASKGIIQRIDYIIVLISILLFLMLHYKKFLGQRMAALIFHCQMWIPLIFLVLGLSGTFNVLNFDSYVESDYKSGIGERFNEDTRTFLYEEAIASAIDNNYVIWGRTPGYGYDSFFEQYHLDLGEKTALDVKSQMAQRASEVFVVNMFTWCGLLGLVFFFVFYYSIGLSILRQTKNDYLRMFVLYIGFFWILCFISHQFFVPSSDYIMLYIIIAICMNPKLQNVSNKTIELKLRSLLN